MRTIDPTAIKKKTMMMGPTHISTATSLATTMMAKLQLVLLVGLTHGFSTVLLPHRRQNSLLDLTLFRTTSSCTTTTRGTFAPLKASEEDQQQDSPPPAEDIRLNDDDFDRLLDNIVHAMTVSPRIKHEDFIKELETKYVTTHWLTRVITAWARSNDPQALRSVDYILTSMTALYKSGYDYVQPNTVTYNAVINCLAHHNTMKKKKSDAAQRAQGLLEEMWELVESGENTRVKPSTITYSSVLKTWSVSHHVDIKGKRAEATLREQWERYNKDEGKNNKNASCKPDGRTYTNVVAAWGTSNHKDAYVRAQALIDEMWKLYKEGDESMKPNKITMTYLLKALASQEEQQNQSRRKVESQSTALAEAVVKDMWTRFKDGGEDDMKPNAIVYTALMQVWLHSRDRDAVKRVQQLLDEMKERHYQQNEGDFRPDAVAYGVVIEKLAHVPLADAADRAEGLVMELWNKTESGEFYCRPTTDHYWFAIQARSRSKQRDAPVLAERLLDDMLERFHAGDRRLWPNIKVFLGVLQAIGRSRSGRKPSSDVPERIRGVLDKMYTLQDSGVRSAAPERITMSTVMDTLTRNHDQAHLIQAEATLQTMWDRGVGSGLPDKVTYLTVMSAWTKSGGSDALERSERLYQDMWKRYEETGNVRVKPDTNICNAMIAAYAKSRRPDAFDKASEVLADMFRRQKEGDATIRPDTVSHNSLLNTLSKSKTEGAAEKAEQILRDMWKSNTIQPNVVTISTVVDAWSHTKTRESPLRAEAILEEAWKRYNAGDVNLKPNEFTYTPLILAWCLGRDSKGPYKAEAYMRRMWDEGLSPNKIIYGHIISSYSKLKTEEGAERAEALLREQWKRQDEGNRKCKPDVVGCNAVILACANSAAPERAQAILEEMLRRFPTDRDMRPTRLTYNAVLSAWGKSGRKDGAQRAQALMDDLVKHHGDNKQVAPDRINFTNVMSAWARSDDEQAVEKASLILKNLWKRAEAGEETMRPDAAAYASVILAHTNSGRDDTYDKAKELFQEMKDRKVRFNTRFFLTYFKALGEKEGTGEETELALHEMEKLSDQGFECNPDTFVYNTVISSLIRNSSGPDGIQRATSLLHEMWKRHEETGDKRYRPDTTTYSTLIRAHRHSTEPSAKDEAQLLVDDMQSRLNAGDTRFARRDKPTATTNKQLDNEQVADIPEVLETIAAETSSETSDNGGEVWIDESGHIRYSSEETSVTS